MQIKVSHILLVPLLLVAAIACAPKPAPTPSPTAKPKPSPTPAPPAGELRLTIEPARTSYRVFEPMTVRLILENGFDRTVAVNGRLLLNDPVAPDSERDIIFILVGPDGTELPFQCDVDAIAPQEEDFVSLAPGEYLEREYDLAQSFEVMHAGVYVVVAMYENQDDGGEFGLEAWTGVLESEGLEIELAPSEPIPTICYVAFNLRWPPFDNVLVRQAFAMALDREAIASERGGDVQAATTFTPDAIWPQGPPGKVGFDYDPERARAKLAEAGYSAEGLTDIQLITSEGLQSVAEILVRNWQESLGVQVELVTLPWAEYQERLQNRQLPHMYLLAWRADYFTPYNFLADVFHSGSFWNYTAFADAEYDDLVTEAALAEDESEAQELYLRAERILVEEQAIVAPLYYYGVVLE